MCDQVSDAILDACLEQDPESKVACETARCTKTNMFMVFGEITIKAKVNYEKIVHDTCREIRFVGLDADNCKKDNHRHLSVNEGHSDKMCDQVSDAILDACLEQDLKSKVAYETARCTKTNMFMVFGEIAIKAKVLVYIEEQSSDISQVFMATLVRSQRKWELVTKVTCLDMQLMKQEFMPLTHALATKLGAMLTEVRKNKTCPWLRPMGKPSFVIVGLTGIKIIIDTYGGWDSHDGGAFSSKDPTKVDRNGAYIVRQAAKSVMASGLPHHCIVHVAYAIGVSEPLSVFVDTLRMIAMNLDLKKERYQKTTAYELFGRDESDFTWEIVKVLNVDVIK
ncbi:hypothetical protein LWI29_022095 [Acer saccharum]|uniref:Methionine adenosyltransferase n=1 Tax=Acer saccharum TaxID=4024 RepID=A0AA39S2Q1_ACESA|nr:hypothetical protein LWI29_022095 [Acer saccharum]